MNKKVCSCCGIEKKLDDFYYSSTEFNKATGRINTCKGCLLEFVKPEYKNLYDMSKIYDALRMIDKPFIKDLWDSSIVEADKNNREYFKMYMKNVAMNQYRDLTWKDTEFKNRELSPSDSDESLHFTDVEIDEDSLNETMAFFGKGFLIEDYIWLSAEYQDFRNRYECDSKSMELLIKQICLTELDIEKRRANNEKVDAQLKTLQDLLGSSSLKPVQETGANSVEQETFGTLIKKWENEQPIPEPDEAWKDVDGISKYIQVFFTGHLARMLGRLDGDTKDKYEDEMKKFTVDEPIKEDGDEDEFI